MPEFKGQAVRFVLEEMGADPLIDGVIAHSDAGSQYVSIAYTDASTRSI
jgi:hypothetical protein